MTPPSLASQWADELALHAPTLKVFVYNGWSKLEVPITEYDVELERNRRKINKSKRTEVSAKSNRQKRKLTYSNNEDGMDVDEPEITSGMNGEVDGEEGSETTLDWCSYINTFDVCITTYNVLRQDFTVARAPPIRPRRVDVTYSNVERARSPLVMCEWYRVIMDEVQMVGGGKTE